MRERKRGAATANAHFVLIKKSEKLEHVGTFLIKHTELQSVCCKKGKKSCRRKEGTAPFAKNGIFSGRRVIQEGGPY